MEIARRYAALVLLLLALLAAGPVSACCPTDPDSLADEAGSEVLDLIAGRILRQPREYWQARIETLTADDAVSPQRQLELARAYAGAGQWTLGLQTIDALANSSASDPDGGSVKELQTRIALSAWWRGGSDEFTPQECLRIAEAAAHGSQHSQIYSHIVAWAKSTRRADPDAYLPDFLDLRYFTNKTESKDNGELADRGLSDAEQTLLDLLSFDEAWENFDTIYALSMVYVVTGRQNLAAYTRFRAWELDETGHHSRVAGAVEIADIKPLTILRQVMADVLVPVKVVSDDYLPIIRQQYDARRAYALRWQLARAEYAKERIAAGANADTPTFWDSFKAPAEDFPSMTRPGASPASEPPPAAATHQPAAKPAPETAKSAQSPSVTWITLGVLAGILILGALVKARINAGTTRMQHDDAEADE
ncbi:MAG: hypothetical protein KDB90_03760 [Planctomycetes bacterium]|nr:hypothetical protein [Planctomycetota bacterium]